MATSDSIHPDLAALFAGASAEERDAALHGAKRLPGVSIESYSLDMRDENGYFGERVSNGAFKDVLDELRRQWLELGETPIAGSSQTLSKKNIDALLVDGKPREAALVFSAVETFAQNVAKVSVELLQVEPWRGVERIVVGGGFRQSKVGELVIGRAEVLLRAHYPEVEMHPIRHHPDEAGLIGCAHLAPREALANYDAILAVDIGGSNFRGGVVDITPNGKGEVGEAKVWKSELWRHAEENTDREDALEKLGEMLRDLLARAEDRKKRVAPFIGVGCPGTVLPDGSLKGGVLNLPGDWAAKDFNLAAEFERLVPKVGGRETAAAIHNDAVVQGLSELVHMGDVERWAVLTIGTGLGNASFRNE